MIYIYILYRCAAGIKEVTDTCLSGLIALLSNSDGMFNCLTTFWPYRLSFLAYFSYYCSCNRA